MKCYFTECLINNGFKYIIVPKKCTTKFYATTCEMVGNDFDDNAPFVECRAENDYEKAILSVFKKNTFIKLGV